MNMGCYYGDSFNAPGDIVISEIGNVYLVLSVAHGVIQDVMNLQSGRRVSWRTSCPRYVHFA